MKRLTLYTGKSGFELASRESNFWATDFGNEDDYKFTIDEEDIEEIFSQMYEITNFDSIEFEKDEVSEWVKSISSNEMANHTEVEVQDGN